MSEWIPAAERVPENIERVLCCTLTKAGRTNIVLGYWDPDDERWVCGMNSNVIAWMPLPEPPGEWRDKA